MHAPKAYGSRCTCAEGIMVVDLCVRLSVCVSVSNSDFSKDTENQVLASAVQTHVTIFQT